MITTVTSVQRFATKTLYTRARATDGSTMLAPMSPGAGKGLIASTTLHLQCTVSATAYRVHEITSDGAREVRASEASARAPWWTPVSTEM